MAQEAHYEAQVESKDNDIEQLQEALVLADNARFASNSEALRTLQLVLFNEKQNKKATKADYPIKLIAKRCAIENQR